LRMMHEDFTVIIRAQKNRSPYARSRI
jgi:hypothetical protein